MKLPRNEREFALQKDSEFSYLELGDLAYAEIEEPPRYKPACTCDDCVPSEWIRRPVKGTADYPLTERMADDIAAHGEEWTRSYHSARGVPDWELDVLMDGARRVLANKVNARLDEAELPPVVRDRVFIYGKEVFGLSVLQVRDMMSRFGVRP
jgi:hypothetical protein